MQQYVSEKYHGVLIRSKARGFSDSNPILHQLCDEPQLAIAKEVIDNNDTTYSEATDFARGCALYRRVFGGLNVMGPELYDVLLLLNYFPGLRTMSVLGRLALLIRRRLKLPSHRLRQTPLNGMDRENSIRCSLLLWHE